MKAESKNLARINYIRAIPRFRYRSIPHSIRNAPRRYYPARAFVGKVKDGITLISKVGVV